MIPPIFPILSTDATVQSLLGTSPMRAWPFGQGPHSPTYPYATWQIVIGTPENYLGETPDIDGTTIQLDVWAKTAASAEEVAIAIRDALEPHAHMVRFGSTDRDPQTSSYRLSADYQFWVSR